VVLGVVPGLLRRRWRLADAEEEEEEEEEGTMTEQ
jgi:hypothetical protein